MRHTRAPAAGGGAGSAGSAADAADAGGGDGDHRLSSAAPSEAHRRRPLGRCAQHPGGGSSAAAAADRGGGAVRPCSSGRSMAPPAEAREGDAKRGVRCEEMSLAARLAARDCATRREAPLRPLPRSWARALVKDSRDAPMAQLVATVSLTVVPFAFALFARQLPQRHAIGVAYVVPLVAIAFPRYLLMLHYSTHRPAFAIAPLRFYTHYLLPPLFGLPPGLYAAHHCAMHHVAANSWLADASSTERYYRGSVCSYLVYLLRFACTYVELPAAMLKAGRPAEAATCVAGTLLYILGVRALWTHVNAFAALWVFVVPACVALVALSFGNYSQHIFVDARRPHAARGHAYNCLAAADNAWTFNDGYHVVHHADSRCHWSEMPARFAEREAVEGAEDVLCFEGVFFFDGAGAMAVRCLPDRPSRSALVPRAPARVVVHATRERAHGP